MPKYKINIEYIRGHGSSKEKNKLEPLVIEAEEFVAALTHAQVKEALKSLNNQIVDNEIKSLPPEVAAEAVASFLPLYSVQICGEVEEEI